MEHEVHYFLDSSQSEICPHPSIGAEAVIQTAVRVIPHEREVDPIREGAKFIFRTCPSAHHDLAVRLYEHGLYPFEFAVGEVRYDEAIPIELGIELSVRGKASHDDVTERVAFRPYRHHDLLVRRLHSDREGPALPAIREQIRRYSIGGKTGIELSVLRVTRNHKLPWGTGPSHHHDLLLTVVVLQGQVYDLIQFIRDVRRLDPIAPIGPTDPKSGVEAAVDAVEPRNRKIPVPIIGIRVIIVSYNRNDTCAQNLAIGQYLPPPNNKSRRVAKSQVIIPIPPSTLQVSGLVLVTPKLGSRAPSAACAAGVRPRVRIAAAVAVAQRIRPSRVAPLGLPEDCGLGNCSWALWDIDLSCSVLLCNGFFFPRSMHGTALPSTGCFQAARLSLSPKVTGAPLFGVQVERQARLYTANDTNCTFACPVTFRTNIL